MYYYSIIINIINSIYVLLLLLSLFIFARPGLPPAPDRGAPGRANVNINSKY